MNMKANASAPTSMPTANDILSQVLRQGAQKLLAQAVQEEVDGFILEHQFVVDEQGRRLVVKNGFLPARSIQTGVGDVPIQVPRVRKNSDQRDIVFQSKILPPYLKRPQSIENMIPWHRACSWCQSGKSPDGR